MKSLKFNRVALATLALVAGTAAQAQNIERLAGASASQINVVIGLRNLCSASSGAFTVYKTTSATNSLGNIITLTCSANFSGTSTNQVRMNVSGGSLSAVLSYGGLTGAAGVALINPASASCSALGVGTGPLSFLNVAGQLQNCNATGQVTEFTNGGYLDVDGSMFRGAPLVTIPPEVDDTADYVASPFNQAFGVGVSSALYSALQAYQTATGALPATCATTNVSGGVTTYMANNSYTPDCQPSISKAAISALIASGNNQLKKAGANGFIGGTSTVKNDLPATRVISPDLPLNTKVYYCRRPSTSGTQAGAQAYFLNNPFANGDVGGSLGVVGSAAAGGISNFGATFTASTGSGTSDLKTCLNTNPYAFGMLSAENNPIGGSDTFRFVKLSNNWISEGVANAGQAAEAIAGRYDYIFQTVQFCKGGVCTPILTALDGSIQAGSSSPGLWLLSESSFVRPKASNPVTAKP
jgi:hypothetical protein